MEMTAAVQDQIRHTLLELGFAPHLAGYKLLIEAILLYVQDNSLSITKDIYPSLAKQSRLYSAASIERSIRYAISEAWSHGSKREWKNLFPHQSKAPSNMVFIAMLSESWA